ncbi:unnamed protein product [Oppiella nova]|uniref:Uncharacterized protein n=1 Tax=Oppiella nova TaxID=334625 RepID=A0A7R9QIN0_9ACAR|nr:unnamed protein product [Oppiella nova]CAG2166717.1 unnamed protein product [Oppiella nova]
MRSLLFALFFAVTIYSTECSPLKGQVSDIPDIIKTAEMLIERAGQLVDELKAKGRATEAKALALLEDAAIDALQKVKDYHPITELDKLVQKGLVDTLKFAEDKLDKFIQDLEKPPVLNGMATLSKEELLLKLAELLLNSKTVQDFLKKEGKPLLAKGLEALDVVLHDLDTKVHNANPKTEVGKLALKGLEELIAKAEKDLEAEIKKIEDEIHKVPPMANTGDIADILKTGEMLIERAKQLVAELEAKGRGLEAKGLALLEDAAIDALQKVKEYEPKTAIGKIIQEHLVNDLKWAENKLDALIQKLSQ